MTLDYFNEEEELLGLRPTTTTVNSATKVADTAPHVVKPENTNPPAINSTTDESIKGQPGLASHRTGTEIPIDRAGSSGGVENPTTAAAESGSEGVTEFSRWLDTLPPLD